MSEPMTVGSLFSGIGGLDLGLERAGMRVIWQSEIDPYCSHVLAKHWPHVPNLGDITKVDWSSVERPDLICGGYPCQPFSLAGSRAGEDDARHLWPHMVVAIRALRPRFAVMENVPGHLSLGFGRVLGDLAESGYDTEWDCIPAAAVGAPHRRDRVWIVAYAHSETEPRRAVDAFARSGVDADGFRCESVAVGPSSASATSDEESACVETVRRQPRGTRGEMAHPDGSRLEGRQVHAECASERTTRTRSLDDADEIRRRRRAGQLGQGWWGEPSDGSQWLSEPDVGRVADGVPSRVDRLRGLGNAVVPQVAEFIGHQLLAAAGEVTE